MRDNLGSGLEHQIEEVSIKIGIGEKGRSGASGYKKGPNFGKGAR